MEKKNFRFTYNGIDFVNKNAKSEKKARKKLSKTMGYIWNRTEWYLDTNICKCEYPIPQATLSHACQNCYKIILPSPKYN